MGWLKNLDGSPYVPSGEFKIYDPCNKRKDELFDAWDQESIRIGGIPIFYYEIFVNANQVDKTYLEVRDKLYSQHYVELYGMYTPQDNGLNMTLEGYDQPYEEIIIEFNYSYLLNKLGNLPRPQSRIYTPFLQRNWEVIGSTLSDFSYWHVTHCKVKCRAWQNTVTTGNGKVTLDEPPPYKVV